MRLFQVRVLGFKMLEFVLQVVWDILRLVIGVELSPKQVQNKLFVFLLGKSCYTTMIIWKKVEIHVYARVFAK